MDITAWAIIKAWTVSSVMPRREEPLGKKRSPAMGLELGSMHFYFKYSDSHKSHIII